MTTRTKEAGVQLVAAARPWTWPAAVDPRPNGRILVTVGELAALCEPLPDGETSGVLFRHNGTYYRQVRS